MYCAWFTNVAGMSASSCLSAAIFTVLKVPTFCQCLAFLFCVSMLSYSAPGMLGVVYTAEKEELVTQVYVV